MGQMDRGVFYKLLKRFLTCGSVIDDKKESTSDAHAVGVKEADAKQRSNGRIHSRAVPFQHIPESKSGSEGRLNKLAS